ncbi:MAG: glycosyltransferase family 39 protein [Candidatus Hydrogenedentes bacterium]|nr:glycosyltransferase family 39 protein [Candidatus Hydrogenedentota bacterium]
MTPVPQADGPQPGEVFARAPQPRVWIAVLGVTLLGAALRLYNLYGASPIVYEYAWSIDIVPGHFNAFRASHTLYGPLHPPFSDLVLYLTGTLLGMDYGTLRLPGALMNVAAIPLLFVLVRGIFGAGGGLTAALLFALSPTQVWWSQMLTTYPFTIPLAIVSLILVREAVHRGSWWALGGSAAVNFVLLFTHIFYVFLIAAEGAYLLMAFWGRYRYLAAWVGGNALAVLATAGYLYFNLPYYFSAGHVPMPPPLFWLAKFFGDDVFPYTLEFAFDQWSLRPPLPLRLLGPVPVALSNVTLAATIAAVGYLFIRRRALVCAWFRTPVRAATDRAQGGFMLMTALKVVAIGGVAFATAIGIPVFSYRLVSYISVALYAWLGGAIAAVPGPARYACLGLFVVLYGVQTGLVHHYQMRTDWLSPVRDVEQQAAADDLILVHLLDAPVGQWLWKRAAPENTTPVRDAYTLTDILWQANAHLETLRSAGRQGCVWVVVEDAWRDDLPVIPTLDGLGLERAEYPAYGVSKVLVYRVAEPFSPDVLAQAVATQLGGTPCGQFLEPLQAASPRPLDEQDCVQLLRLIRTSWLDWYYFGAGGLAGAAVAATERGQDDLALGLANLAVDMNPKHPYGYFARALAKAQAAGLDAARPDFDAAFARDTRVFSVLEPLVRALYDASTPEEIDAALAPLEGTYALSQALRDVAMRREAELRARAAPSAEV